MAFSSIHLRFMSVGPEYAAVINGFEELFEGRKRCGRSHSGVWRMRYSMQASRGGSISRRLEDSDDSSDKDFVTFEI